MSFDYAHQTHDKLLNNLESKIKDLLNIKVGDRELKVHSIEMPRTVRRDDTKAQKNAKIQGISYQAPVTAELELLEGGKSINRKRIKIMDMPQVTMRGTYIVKGNEYAVPFQKRLIPGVYTREKNDGTTSAWLNSSKGRNISITLRQKGDFVLEVEGSTINLHSVLMGLGISEQAMKRAWGEEVYQTNRNARGATNAKLGLEKLYGKLHYAGDPGVTKKDIPNLKEWILKYFKENSKFDAENVELTLGEPMSETSTKLILAATRKILAVARGDEKEDNKESIIHNSIFDLSDFIIERIDQRQYKSAIKRVLTRNLKDTNRKTVAAIYDKSLLENPINSTFTQTSLGQMPKQNNPMDAAATFSQITVMGEGGIQSAHAVTRDVRAVDPTHLGFIDPVHTPEGQNIGTTLHLAKGVVKKGKTLFTRVYNVRTGAKEEIDPRKFYKSKVTFPEYWEGDTKGEKVKLKLKPGDDGLVKVSYRGEMQRVKPSEVDYAMRVATDMFGVNVIAIPFLSHNNGVRTMTASKMQAQAKPLKYREKPLVQSAVSARQDKLTVEEIVGKNSLPKSPVDGVVKKVAKDEIVITPKGGGEDVYVGVSHNMWMNENNYETTEIKVKVGDKVKKGQILGDSNFTKDGTLALGTNLKTAYITYKGYNHEDGVVISESAAKKLTSLHATQKSIHVNDDEEIEKKKFVSYFPANFTKEQLDKIGDDGIIKKGQIVQKGDPLVTKMKKVDEDTMSGKLKNISRLLVQDYRNTSPTWPKSTPGVVEEVHMRKNDILIVIKTEEKAKIGDKIVGRYGNKGTVTTILPDDEMPKNGDGEPMDLLLDPSGVPGRMNLGQIMETTASQIAEKDGKPFVAKPFSGDYTNVLMKELKKRKMKDHTTLYDKDGPIHGVLAGKQYILKLEQQVEKKMSARAAGPGYSYGLSGQPSKGGEDSGRAIGLGELYGLLSHGAQANLKEMYTFKGDKHYEAWRAVENGTFMPPPKVPATSAQFVAMLRGMGVNLEQEGSVVKMVPFLDRDIKKITNGEIEDATVLRAKDLKEEKGGLFDFDRTGGLDGGKWTHVKLAEPTPHPTFEKSILSVLHMKREEFLEIMKGNKGVLNGEIVKGDAPGAVTGGKAIRSLLKKVDVDGRIEEIKKIAPGKKGSDLNKLHREIRTLKNFKDNGIRLDEMVVEYMPVIPPKFRPIVEMPNGDLSVADVNEHYRGTIQMNNHLKAMADRPGLWDEANKARMSLYEGMRGMAGFSMGLVDKPDIKGISATIAGTNPKSGFYHSKLIKRRQDVSGTAVISPEPKLDMDQIGIPENMAWKTFRPFVVKELKSSGMTAMAAKKAIDERTFMARDALQRVMAERYVFANRAPTLHRWSIMAFKPTLVSGSAVKLPVEVLGGFNADFDGDTMGIHVPTSPEAVQEAQKMLPSNNLYMAGDSRNSLSISLSKEYMMGIYKLTKTGKRTSKIYATKRLALKDLSDKKIHMNDVISVNEIGQTTCGRILANEVLPANLRDYTRILRKREQKNLLVQLEKRYGKDKLKSVIQVWKDLGRNFVFTSGTSFLLSDLQSLTKEKAALYRQADIDAKKIMMNRKLTNEQKKEEKIKIYAKVDETLMNMSGQLKPNASGKSNNITDMVDAGFSKPGKNQLKQLVGTLGMMMDHRNEVMPEPVRGNYAEGLESSEFFSHMFAQRKGIIDRSQSVSGPGMLSKEITNTAATMKVTMADCGTKHGRYHPVDRHIIDRLTAENIAGVPANTVIDDEVLEKIKRSGKTQIKVRTILTCEANAGICAKCFGIDEHGNFPPIGKNLGVSEIQSITERSVQLPMKSFHTGGVATADKGLANAFERTLQILRMPNNIRGKATLAEVGGIVSGIRKSQYGGHIITINGKEHKVPKALKLKVKQGDQVKKGDALSEGIVKPQELLKLKGVKALQDQMTNDLDNAFQSAGIKLHRRTYEVPVKGLTEQVRVTDPGDHPQLLPGDFTTLGKVDSWNKQNPGKKPLKYVSILPGSLYAPLHTEDWARRMALNRIQKTLEEGASFGFQSDREGTNPFADLVLGPGTRVPKPGEE